jgi:dsDNA-binding SOS-regulon protein
MSVKLLIVVEDDVEGVYSFASKAESDAFESGFGMAAGLLGSPSWSIFSKVDDGEWQCDHEDESEKLAEALADAKRAKYEVD